MRLFFGELPVEFGILISVDLVNGSPIRLPFVGVVKSTIA